MSKSVVVFYSWAGHTRKMAEHICKETGAAVVEIYPQQPYSQNYNHVLNQVKKEIQEGNLPPITNMDDLGQYDIIYIGTPVWWGTMAPPLAAFLKKQVFEGKTVMPFCTHGGGGKGHTDRDIAKLCSGAKMMNMFAAYEGGSEQEVAAWIETMLKNNNS